MNVKVLLSRIKKAKNFVIEFDSDNFNEFKLSDILIDCLINSLISYKNIIFVFVYKDDNVIYSSAIESVENVYDLVSEIIDSIYNFDCYSDDKIKFTIKIGKFC